MDVLKFFEDSREREAGRTKAAQTATLALSVFSLVAVMVGAVTGGHEILAGKGVEMFSSVLFLGASLFTAITINMLVGCNIRGGLAASTAAFIFGVLCMLTSLEPDLAGKIDTFVRRYVPASALLLLPAVPIVLLFMRERAKRPHLTKDDLTRTAVHEAGHAMVIKAVTDASCAMEFRLTDHRWPVNGIVGTTISARPIRTVPDDDQESPGSPKPEDLAMGNMLNLLAGMIAEEVAFGPRGTFMRSVSDGLEWDAEALKYAKIVGFEPTAEACYEAKLDQSELLRKFFGTNREILNGLSMRFLEKGRLDDSEIAEFTSSMVGGERLLEYCRYGGEER